MSVEDITSQSSVVFGIHDDCWDPIFGVHISPGSAETLFRRANHRLLEYSLSNVTTKNYGNRLMCLEVIVYYISVVFWDSVGLVIIQCTLFSLLSVTLRSLSVSTFDTTAKIVGHARFPIRTYPSKCIFRRSRPTELRHLQKFQTSEMSIKVSERHCYCCHLIRHIWFAVSLLLFVKVYFWSPLMFDVRSIWLMRIKAACISTQNVKPPPISNCYHVSLSNPKLSRIFRQWIQRFESSKSQITYFITPFVVAIDPTLEIRGRA